MTAYGGKEMAAAFRTVRGNTIKVVEEIPDDKLDFVPAPGARSVKQLVAHVSSVTKYNLDVHRDRKLTSVAGYDFPGYLAKLAEQEAKLTTKAQLLAALKANGEEFAGFLESCSDAFLAERVENFDKQGSKSRLELLLSPKEHEMHHRGQLMLILRMLGGTPHLTRERQARAAAQAAAHKA